MRVPLVVDTDPGVDDAVALVVALRSPDADVRAVVANFGNVPLDTAFANARRVTALAGRPDVPVACGAAAPLHGPAPTAARHGADGLAGQAAAFPEPAPADPRSALDLLDDVLASASTPVTVAAIGPLTTVARLLDRPRVGEGAIGRIVVMGGSLGGPATAGVEEFNLHADPVAAQRVLGQRTVPVTLVPLDLTLRCVAGPAWIAGLAESGRAGAALARMLRARQAERPGVPVHDAVAVLEAIAPGSLRCGTVPLLVERGTLVEAAEGVPIGVARETDPQAVLVELARRLS